jgi:hypothetical protein
VAATQILIKWRGLDANHATWEDYDLIKLRFPQAPLWDRDRSQGEESVTPASPSDSAVDSESSTRAEPGGTSTEGGPPSAEDTSG